MVLSARCHTVCFLAAKHGQHYEQVIGCQRRAITFATGTTVSQRVVLCTMYRTKPYCTVPYSMLGVISLAKRTTVSHRVALSATCRTIPYHSAQHSTMQCTFLAVRHEHHCTSGRATTAHLRLCAKLTIWLRVVFSTLYHAVCFMVVKHERHYTGGRPPTVHHHLCKTVNSTATCGTLHNVPVPYHAVPCGSVLSSPRTYCSGGQCRKIVTARANHYTLPSSATVGMTVSFFSLTLNKPKLTWPFIGKPLISLSLSLSQTQASPKLHP